MFKEIWHDILVRLGIRDCCSKPDIIERMNNPRYYLSKCRNCGREKSSIFLSPF